MRTDWLIARGTRRVLQTMCVVLAACLLPTAPGFAAAPADPRAFIDAEIAARPGLTGSYVLERGEEAMLARAWLVDHARHSIEVQYFIWSTDNIGTLATEALLRAADRGVRVRVIVDDLLIDAPDESLLALALHPNIDIRIYNPQHSVGVPLRRRIVNIFTNFRGVNQRMHDKTFIVDGQIAITGGRNMADEYFDFDHEYNFRDREALVLGAVVPQMQASFERFWASELAAPVEELYDGLGFLQANVAVDAEQVREVYRGLRGYAAAPENFAPEIRAVLQDIPTGFPELAARLSWGRVTFLSDQPGKNSGAAALGGGGLTTAALAKLVGEARREVVIQSPYLVMSDAAIELFRQLRARGVRVRISTNSLASTDNLQAYSGYRNQRDELLAMGLEIHEYRPDPAVRTVVMQRYAALREQAPVFALHAKTLVVDESVVYIGTFNLDPRSENLNTEVGVVIHDPSQARAVAASIVTDMLPANSWSAADEPDQYAPWGKRLLVLFWQWMPIKPLL
ncbi:MAG: phospholipase D family protein [Steroidobacteraceae bacterium]